MSTKTTIALSVAIVLGAGSAALANDYQAPWSQRDNGDGYLTWTQTHPVDAYGYAAFDAYGYAALPKQTDHRVAHARVRDR